MPWDLLPTTTKSPPVRRLCVAVAVLGLILNPCLAPASAQKDSQTPVEEIVANLAAGRVIIAVVKDAIVVATVENSVEPETRPPTPVALGGERVGIILGPVYWFSPSSQQELASLDTELPHLRSGRAGFGAQVPHLQANQSGHEASDIEATGQGLLDRLNVIAKGLRGKVDTPSNEPLAELILADYLPDYGPEVWQLTYEMKQVEQERDFWETHFLRPSYSQLWPPEKGQPRTLVEFDYPLENSPATLLELLRRKDSRLEKIRASSPNLAEVADLLLRGESNKVMSSDAVPFLRAAMSATAKPESRQTLAVIGQETGIQWIVPPPPEIRKSIQQAAQQPGQTERPADAPSLLHPPSR
jgi:hypothetical protein